MGFVVFVRVTQRLIIGKVVSEVEADMDMIGVVVDI